MCLNPMGLPSGRARSLTQELGDPVQVDLPLCGRRGWQPGSLRLSSFRVLGASTPNLWQPSLRIRVGRPATGRSLGSCHCFCFWAQHSEAPLKEYALPSPASHSPWPAVGLGRLWMWPQGEPEWGWTWGHWRRQGKHLACDGLSDSPEGRRQVEGRPDT